MLACLAVGVQAAAFTPFAVASECVAAGVKECSGANDLIPDSFCFDLWVISFCIETVEYEPEPSECENLYWI